MNIAYKAVIHRIFGDLVEFVPLVASEGSIHITHVDDPSKFKEGQVVGWLPGDKVLSGSDEPVLFEAWEDEE